MRESVCLSLFEHVWEHVWLFIYNWGCAFTGESCVCLSMFSTEIGILMICSPYDLRLPFDSSVNLLRLQRTVRDFSKFFSADIFTDMERFFVSLTY